MVLHTLFAALVSITLVEIVRRMPLLIVARRAVGVAQKARRILMAPASDHWKEQAMRAYAGAMAFATAQLLGLLMVIAAVVGLLVAVFDVINAGFVEFLLAPVGLIATLMLSSLYAVGRARIR